MSANKLYLIWNKGVRLLTADQKWEKVKIYYERSNPRFKFKSRPTPHQIEMLYEKMKKLETSLDWYYRENPHLKDRLLYLRGLLPEDPVKKRQSHE